MTVTFFAGAGGGDAARFCGSTSSSFASSEAPAAVDEDDCADELPADSNVSTDVSATAAGVKAAEGADNGAGRVWLEKSTAASRVAGFPSFFSCVFLSLPLSFPFLPFLAALFALAACTAHTRQEQHRRG